MRWRRFSWCGLGVLIALLAAPVESLCEEPSEAKEEEETKPRSMWRYTRFPDQIPPEDPPPARETDSRVGYVAAGGIFAFMGSVFAVTGFLAAAHEQAREASNSSQIAATEGWDFCSRRENAGLCQSADSTIDSANLALFGGILGLVGAVGGGGLLVYEFSRSPAPRTEPQAAVVVMPGRAGLWVVGSF